MLINTRGFIAIITAIIISVTSPRIHNTLVVLTLKLAICALLFFCGVGAGFRGSDGSFGGSGDGGGGSGGSGGGYGDVVVIVVV